MKNVALALFVLLFASALAFPSVSYAQVPFGGLVVAEIICTCSPYTWQWLVPLYTGGLIPITGALAVPDTPFTYAFYYSTIGTWMLGLYIPGNQSCMMYVGLGCVVLPSLGSVTPFTGTSL